jgi:hypothetical protein
MLQVMRPQGNLFSVVHSFNIKDKVNLIGAGIDRHMKKCSEYRSEIIRREMGNYEKYNGQVALWGYWRVRKIGAVVITYKESY